MYQGRVFHQLFKLLLPSSGGLCFHSQTSLLFLRSPTTRYPRLPQVFESLYVAPPVLVDMNLIYLPILLPYVRTTKTSQPHTYVGEEALI